MQDLNIEKFSPTKAELSSMAAEASKITEASSPAEVKDMKSRLSKTRIDITKFGKGMREDALAFQKAVIAKEKELIAIISPEEERLDQILEQQEKQRILDERREFLPRRRERLTAIGDKIEVSDEELLEMDGTQFEGYFNQRMAAKNEADRQAIEDAKALEGQEEREKKRKQEIDEAEERGRKEAADRKFRNRIQILVDRGFVVGDNHTLESKELGIMISDEAIATESDDAFMTRVQDIKDEQRRRADKKREEIEAKHRSEDQRYQDFLKSHGYDDRSGEFYTTQGVDGVIILWKKVATFDPSENV